MLITCGKLFIITLVINDIFEKVPIFDLFRVYNIFHIHVNTFWEVFQSFLRNIFLFTGNVTLVRIMLPYSICSTVDFPFSEEGIFRSDFILTSSIFDTQKVTVAGHQSFARLTAGSFLSGISDIRIEKVPQGRQIRFQHSYIARIAEDDSRFV